jgi:hypothetical protein
MQHLQILFLWLHFISTSPIEGRLCARLDTCRLIEVEIAKPFRGITNYQSHYKQLKTRYLIENSYEKI